MRAKKNREKPRDVQNHLQAPRSFPQRLRERETRRGQGRSPEPGVKAKKGPFYMQGNSRENSLLVPRPGRESDEFNYGKDSKRKDGGRRISVRSKSEKGIRGARLEKRLMVRNNAEIGKGDRF